VQPDEEPWPVEWPDHNNTDRPVVLRRPPHRVVDGAGNEVNRDQGLEAMFGVVHRRGNRVPARARGQAGLFSGDEGAWLRRVWRANARRRDVGASTFKPPSGAEGTGPAQS